MKVKEAQKIPESMTRTSKMPGLSYSLPAWECQTGAKLRKGPGHAVLRLLCNERKLY